MAPLGLFRREAQYPTRPVARHPEANAKPPSRRYAGLPTRDRRDNGEFSTVTSFVPSLLYAASGGRIGRTADGGKSIAEKIHRS